MIRNLPQFTLRRDVMTNDAAMAKTKKASSTRPALAAALLLAFPEIHSEIGLDAMIIAKIDGTQSALLRKGLRRTSRVSIHTMMMRHNTEAGYANFPTFTCSFSRSRRANRMQPLLSVCVNKNSVL